VLCGFLKQSVTYIGVSGDRVIVIAYFWLLASGFWLLEVRKVLSIAEKDNQ